MDLSIIIINFNTPEVTCNCLQSIYKHCQDIKFEIILIDNFPKQNYADVFLTRFPTIHYLVSEENVGFGRANNLGMSKAIGRYFLLLNSDTLFIDDSIKKCITYLDTQENPKVQLLGCKLLNADGSYQPSFFPFLKNEFLQHCISNNTILSKLFNRSQSFSEPDTVKNVGVISGAFMLLKKDLYISTKGFDPDFFLYYEESDWCQNRILKNHSIVYFPFASVIHLIGSSAPKDFMQIQAKISEGLLWYKKGTLKYIAYLSFEILNLIYYLLSYIFTPNKRKIASKQRIKNVVIALPYWFKDIPKYKKQYGSRESLLIYKKASHIFFTK